MELRLQNIQLALFAVAAGQMTDTPTRLLADRDTTLGIPMNLKETESIFEAGLEQQFTEYR